MYRYVICFTILFSVIIYINAEDSTRNNIEITPDEYFDILTSGMQEVFHRKPDIIYLPPRGIIRFVTLKDENSNDSLIRVKVNNTYHSRTYDLNLIPLEHNVISDRIPISIIWTVSSSPNQTPNYTYHVKGFGSRSIVGKFYQDVDKMAILLVQEEGGYNYYDGTVGECLTGHVVRPIPQKWKNTIYDVTHEDHIVFKRSAGQARAPLNILYPKLLIIVDYSLYEAIGSVNETIKYITTYWNAVNLKYSTFTNPKVKIIVTGMVIATDDGAMNYINKSTTLNFQNRLFLNNDVLGNTRKYFHKQFIDDTGYANYDATIIMTALTTSYLGLAYVGSICLREYGTAYVRDIGDYASISTAVHELGHLLNMPHDGSSRSANCTSIPKKVSENHEVGTIMASPKQFVHEYEWSECSKEILANLAKTSDSDCLRNRYRLT